MEGNGFKGLASSHRVSYRILAVLGTVAVFAVLLFPSASALEVWTDDGRDHYEQGEIIIFRLHGLNNSTIYVNLVHVVTTEVNETTVDYMREWYGLPLMQLNETGNASLILRLNPFDYTGNKRATYGHWDFEIFESVNESVIEYTGYRYYVDVNWDVILLLDEMNDQKKEEENQAFLAGIDNRDMWKNIVIVVLAFLFLMTVATYHLGENPVIVFLRGAGLALGKVVRSAEQGEVDAVTKGDGRTVREWKWREREDVEKAIRDDDKDIAKAYRKIETIDSRAESRKVFWNQRIKDKEKDIEDLKKLAESFDVPERDKLMETIRENEMGD